jgi:hypothetical protein
VPLAGGPTNRPEEVSRQPRCPSQVEVVEPDGSVHCVPATPEAQALVGGNPSGGNTLFDMFGLPFTGVDLAGAVGVAFVALLVGLGLRSRTRSGLRR